MLTRSATLKQTTIITMFAGILFLACCWHKTLVGLLIVVPLIVLILGIPCVIAIQVQRVKKYFRQPQRSEH